MLLVYQNNSQIDGDEIFGSELYRFFEPSNYIKKVKIEYDKDILHELEQIKQKLEVAPKISKLELNEAYYSYAFIFKKDTLYAHPSFSSWKFKDKIIEYNKRIYFEKAICTHGSILEASFFALQTTAL